MLVRVCASALALAVFLCGSVVPSFAVDASPSPAPVTREDLEEIIGDPGSSRVWDFSDPTRLSLSYFSGDIKTSGSPSVVSCSVSNAGYSFPADGVVRQNIDLYPKQTVAWSSFDELEFRFSRFFVSLNGSQFLDDFSAGSSVFWSFTFGPPVASVVNSSGSLALDVLTSTQWNPGNCRVRVEYGKRSGGVIVPGSGGVVEVGCPVVITVPGDDRFRNISVDVSNAFVSIPAGYTPENISLYGFPFGVSWLGWRPSSGSFSGNISAVSVGFDYSSTLTVTAAPQNVYFYLRQILNSLGSGSSGAALDAILAKLSDIYMDTQNLSATVALIPPLLDSLPSMASDLSAIRSALDAFSSNQSALASFTPSPDTVSAGDAAGALLDEQSQFDEAEAQYTDGLNASLSAVDFSIYSIPDAFQSGIGWVSEKFTDVYEGLGTYKIFYLLPLAIGLAFSIIGGLARSDIGRKFRDGENSGG